jgi:hypothetical protein
LIDSIDLMLNNEWVLQHKACLNIQFESSMIYKGHRKMIVCVNPMQSQSPNPRRRTPMHSNGQFKMEQPHLIDYNRR